MTTSAVYDLIPNEDAGQNTRYPLGDKPAAELAPPIPTFLDTSGETVTSIDLNWGQLGDGHTKFVLQRWRLNTDTVWTTLTEPGKDDRNYTDSADLLEGQHVGYRIASSDGVNQSDWAPEAWTYVLRTPGGSIVTEYMLQAGDWNAGQQGEGSAFNEWTWAREMYVTDERGYRSNKSWKGTRSVPVPGDEQGWREWGFTKNFTTPVKKGGMIHVQSTFYLPLDFDCYAAWALKWLRFRQQTAGGASGIGHQDVYLFNEDSNWWPTPIGPKGTITHIQEGNAIGANGWTKTTGVIDLGQWVTFEYQTTLDNVPVDQGGQGRTRVWYGPAGGQLDLLMDKTSAGTLDAATNEYNLFYIFGGVWNNTSSVLTPFTPQTAYISEVYMTTRENELTNTDANGNKIIGF